MTSTADTEALLRHDLDAYWMPFTANRAFKQSPRLLAYAEDMHYYSPEGRAIIDGSAGLWCANAGHCRASIVEAIRAQAGELLFRRRFSSGIRKRLPWRAESRRWRQAIWTTCSLPIPGRKRSIPR